MAEWIALGVLLSPLAWKVIQLRVFQFDKGFVHMEFGKPLEKSSKPKTKSIEKKTRKQVSH
jgi:hypothetical protein